MTYRIVHQLSDQQVNQLVGLYQNEFWSHGRKRPDVDTMLANSDIVIALVDEADSLAGFCRVLTDGVYRATLYDMIIAPQHRNQGLGRQIMDFLLAHPKLVGVEHIDLACLTDKIPFYQRWQFNEETSNVRLLRRYHARTLAQQEGK